MFFDVGADVGAVVVNSVGDSVGVLYSFELVPEALVDVKVDLDEADEEDEELAVRFAGRGLMMGDEADFPRLGRGDEEADEAGFGLGCAC